MNKDPFLKLQSSLSLEDLLAQPNPRNTQNWLLTYLDVFVLIVMLVITMITISDINIEQQAAATKQQMSQLKNVPSCPPVPPVSINCPTTAEHKVDINTESKEISIPPINAPEVQVTKEPTAPVVQQAVDRLTDEHELQQKLTKTIDEFGLNKAVNIKVTQGYAQLEIQDSVLFKSSEASLTTSGESLLKRLVPLLKQAVGLILIEGHTDNIPIKSAQFPSNWELGSSRATSVLHFLVSQQLDSSHLRAITYADTMPIADNSTQEGRKKNRRVNILIKFSESN